ncbi:MAG: hypothetical protein RSP_13550 [Rhodanobacter sp.]
MQLWAVIALLLYCIASSILSALYNRKRQDSDSFKSQFKYLWESNELDKLLSETERYRNKFPNNVDAHYFAIKALLAKKRFSEARDLSKNLAKIEPELDTVIQKWLAITERDQAS